MLKRMAVTAGLMGIAGLLAACLPGIPQRDPEANGRQLYADYCASCHGTDGKGAGVNTKDLRQKPADLTQLSAKNNGTFPQLRVMGKVYGYRDGREGASPMPHFGALVEGPTVLVETAPGVMTPTPEKLVALAEYVESLGK